MRKNNIDFFLTIIISNMSSKYKGYKNMKKQFIFAGGFFLGVCCSLISFSLQNANAQNSVEGVVGNPDSSNSIIVEQTYGVIENTPQTPQTMPENMEPLPDSPGVEVGPIPANSEQTNTPQTPQSSNEPSDANIEIDEIIETE